MSALEIVEEVLRGRTAYHRVDDSWDLLNEQRLVVAVLCTTKRGWVSVYPLQKPAKPVPKPLMPSEYRDDDGKDPKVKCRISRDPGAVDEGLSVEEGVKLVGKLVAASTEEIRELYAATAEEFRERLATAA